MPTVPGGDYFVQLNIAAPATVTFLCFIHPGMVGSISVVAGGSSTPASVLAAAAAQYTSDTNAALAAEAAVVVPAAVTNADGTKTYNNIVGTEAPYMQVLEYFPARIDLKTGDSVKFKSGAHDIHTVTNPNGGTSASTDFHQFLCEATPSTNPDTPAGPPPNFCTNPADFESHFTPAPFGPTTLASPATVATSGVIGAPPLPFPDSYTFKFAGAGTYTYQCTVHDHMTGQVLAAVGLPVSGAAPTAPPPSRGGGTSPLGFLAVAAILIAAFAGRLVTRRT